MTRLLSIATRVPRHRGSQEAALRFQERVLERADLSACRRERLIDLARRLYAGAGIRARHAVIGDFLRDDPAEFRFFPRSWDLEPFPTTAARMRLYERESVPLAVEVAGAALREAGIAPAEVTHLLLASCTGFFAPGPDVLLARELGLPARVERALIGYMGCHAGLVGLRLADRIVRSDPGAVVLQVSVELGSLHFQKRPEPSLLLANALFADGAAAALYGAPGRGSGAGLGSVVFSASRTDARGLEKMAWRIGDHGFEMRLSPELPRALGEGAPSFVAELLAAADRRPGDVRRWAIHPGGPRILDALAEALELEEEQLEPARAVLASFGNLSSATIFFVLEELLERAEEGPVVALAFGPGLSIEGALLEDTEPPPSRGGSTRSAREGDAPP